MTALRLKLPAYGKQLLNDRRLGRHPLVVHVIYDEDWRFGEQCEEGCETLTDLAHARLAVKPSEFAPWVYDWHAVTGCYVALFDGRHDCLEGSPNFWRLVGEIGRFAGPVCIYRWQWTSLSGRVGGANHALAFTAHRVASEVRDKLGGWPDWWPLETERANVERRERWWRAKPDHPEQRAALVA